MTYESKKRRVSTACDSCRVKKTKCNGLAPCEKCLDENKPCTYTEKKKSVAKTYSAEHMELCKARYNVLMHSFLKVLEWIKINDELKLNNLVSELENMPECFNEDETYSSFDVNMTIQHVEKIEAGDSNKENKDEKTELYDLESDDDDCDSKPTAITTPNEEAGYTVNDIPIMKKGIKTSLFFDENLEFSFSNSDDDVSLQLEESPVIMTSQPRKNLDSELSTNMLNLTSGLFNEEFIFIEPISTKDTYSIEDHSSSKFESPSNSDSPLSLHSVDEHLCKEESLLDDAFYFHCQTTKQNSHTKNCPQKDSFSDFVHRHAGNRHDKVTKPSHHSFHHSPFSLKHENEVQSRQTKVSEVTTYYS